MSAGNGLDVRPETDLEGCEKGPAHCHGRRRGIEAYTEAGYQRVCHRAAGHGTDHKGFGVCNLHGGSTAAGRKHAQKLRVAALLATLTTYGDPVSIDPAQALLDEVQRTAGHVQWLGMCVAQLDPDELTWGKTSETEIPGSSHPDGTELASAVVTEIKRSASPATILSMYQAERKHLVFVSKAALDAGASARLVEVFSEVGTTFVNMINRVMDQLELSPEQAAKLPALMTGELAAIRGVVEP